MRVLVYTAGRPSRRVLALARSLERRSQQRAILVDLSWRGARGGQWLRYEVPNARGYAAADFYRVARPDDHVVLLNADSSCLGRGMLQEAIEALEGGTELVLAAPLASPAMELAYSGVAAALGAPLPPHPSYSLVASTGILGKTCPPTIWSFEALEHVVARLRGARPLVLGECADEVPRELAGERFARAAASDLARAVRELARRLGMGGVQPLIDREGGSEEGTARREGT
ncbi:MAG: hypothetical protein ABWK00_01895 [Desulfurococcaceae archaeon]